MSIVILLGSNGKRTLYDQIPFGYEIFTDDEPYMQTKNGVYCCSLDICMTSDNYYSLDQDNQAAFAADQLLDRQANDEWSYAPLEMLKRLKVYLRRTNQQRAEDRWRKYTAYPRKARSLLESPASAPAASSAPPCSRSSTGKYDVSVMDRKRGTNGASICRMMLQSTP